MGLHSDSAAVHGDLSTGAAVVIAACCVVFLAALSAMAYKCYRRRLMRNAQNRLSSAIKKGLQESSTSGSFKKSLPVRGTGSGPRIMKSKSTSPISPPTAGDTASTDRMTGSQSSGGGEPVQGMEVYLENEKDGATPEKEEEVLRGEHGEVEKEGGEEGRELLDRETPSRQAQPQPIKLGSLSFSVDHDEAKHALVVTVVGAHDLPPPRDPAASAASGAISPGCDPYVKLQLLPEKKHKCKTRVVRKTLNPRYEETFTFYGIHASQIMGVTLHFVVLSFDRFSRDEIIGEVLYPLSEADVEKKNKGEEEGGEEAGIITRDITPRHLKYRTQGRGEMLVSLCYQPAANRLGVVVLKARNLPKMDVTGLSDPYVKIYLLYNGQRIAKKKTHVKKRTLNPVFNESFLFDVPYNEGLQNISLEFLVLDWDRMTKNEVVGRLEIGVKVGGHEGNHWKEVMNCPRKQIAEWHKLLE